MKRKHRKLFFASLVWLMLIGWQAAKADAQTGLNPAGAPRYGKQVLAPGFEPAPFRFTVVSGGEHDVSALNLGDNCLGFVMPDPDFAVHLEKGFGQITFLVDSAEDTTLIVNLPDGSWLCSDDANGLNPALEFRDAAGGSYRIWIGSYSKEVYSSGSLWISEGGRETLPTTATGPDPSREPLYGQADLEPGFFPSPRTVQLVGGGRNRIAEFVTTVDCRGYVAEAPDYSLYLLEDFDSLRVAVHSPANMTLLINAPDGSWRCNKDLIGADPSIGFYDAPPGLYDIWVGSHDEGNYAAGILYVTESETRESSGFVIDTGCPGMLSTELRVGAYAEVSRAGDHALHAAPERAAGVLSQAEPGAGMSLLGGPICQSGWRWWRVSLDSGHRGWMADGDGAEHWLVPRA